MYNIKEIIKCFQEQTREQIIAMKNLFENEIVLARMEIRADMNRHMINHHDRNIVPNSDNYLELLKKQEREVWKLREKLDEASKKLAELIEKASSNEDNSSDINKDHKISGYPSPTA